MSWARSSSCEVRRRSFREPSTCRRRSRRTCLRGTEWDVSLRGPLSERSERRGRGNPDLCRHPLLSTSPPVPLSLAGEGEPSLVIARPPERAARAKGPWQSHPLSCVPIPVIARPPERAARAKGPWQSHPLSCVPIHVISRPPERAARAKGPWQSRSLSSSPAFYLTPCPPLPRGRGGTQPCHCEAP